MNAIDVDKLVADIRTAASGILQKDITTVKGFSDRQIKAIGQQAALVAKGIADDQIPEDMREFFLGNIETMTENFLATLEGLLVITVEKLWNAIVGVIWGAINDATKLAFPVPTKI